MKAKTFDRKFDSGEEIVDQIELVRTDVSGPTRSESTWISLLGWWTALTEKRAGWV
jgi:hypothetical protein